jgi:hypothetical protein
MVSDLMPIETVTTLKKIGRDLIVWLVHVALILLVSGVVSIVAKFCYLLWRKFRLQATREGFTVPLRSAVRVSLLKSAISLCDSAGID